MNDVVSRIEAQFPVVARQPSVSDRLVRAPTPASEQAPRTTRARPPRSQVPPREPACKPVPNPFPWIPSAAPYRPPERCPDLDRIRELCRDPDPDWRQHPAAPNSGGECYEMLGVGDSQCDVDYLLPSSPARRREMAWMDRQFREGERRLEEIGCEIDRIRKYATGH